MSKIPSIVKIFNKLSKRLSRKNLISSKIFKSPDGNSRNSLAVKLLNRLPIYLAAEPYQVWISSALFISGVTTLVYPRASGAVHRILPLWEVYSWGTSLVVGSFLTLYGLVMASWSSDPVSHRFNREWERFGQLLLGISTAVWSVVTFSFGAVGITSGIFTLFFSLVCFTRALILRAIDSYTPLSRVEAIRALREVGDKIKSLQEGKDNGSD